MMNDPVSIEALAVNDPVSIEAFAESKRLADGGAEEETELIPKKQSVIWRDDWPAKTGPIDLVVHDLPHKSSGVEWWYINTHLKTESGKDFSLFACFFRTSSDDNEISRHSLIWAITDVANNKYHEYSTLDPTTPDYLERNIHKEGLDPHLGRSLVELFKERKVPKPDTLIEGDINVSTDKLHLDFGGDQFYKDSEGNYHIELNGKRSTSGGTEFTVSLQFKPLKPPARNTGTGVFDTAPSGDEMFYYFITRNACSGTISIDGEECAVAGNAWYDHEFGGNRPTNEKGVNVNEKGANDEERHVSSISTHLPAWMWLSLQLSDGSDVTSCVLEDISNPEKFRLLESYVLTIAKDGTTAESRGQHFKSVPGALWRSTRTFVEYPTQWTLKSGDIDLKITAGNCQDQEFVTLLSYPSIWEGRVECTGTIAGRKVTGLGYVEHRGYSRKHVESIGHTMKECAKETHKLICDLMPLETDGDNGAPISDYALDSLIGSDGCDAIKSFPNDIGRQAVIKNVIEPLRDAFDRGGKAWRSNMFSICVDAVGGNSGDFKKLLPIPELVHTASLIIDDIQDKSEHRRGKPCTHIIYGEPIAINAGCFSYFLVHRLYKDLPDDIRLKMLDLYFATMLAGHAGQGIDIAGLDDIMPEVVETGNSKLATDYLLGIHRMKTGIPAKHVAQGGCIVGGGTDEQIDAVGSFFETVGTAFQIMDDVVNLEGFKFGSWKTCGEDVMEGKVTFPVALSMKYLDKAARQDLWTKLQNKPQDEKAVADVINIVRKTGAIQECKKLTTEMTEEAWKKASPVLEDSFSKIALRATGLFILDSLKESSPHNHRFNNYIG
jgi:geranylgeranyl pyrophosphate synthase/predicted secreted hydrolase